MNCFPWDSLSFYDCQDIVLKRINYENITIGNVHFKCTSVAVVPGT